MNERLYKWWVDLFYINCIPMIKYGFKMERALLLQIQCTFDVMSFKVGLLQASFVLFNFFVCNNFIIIINIIAFQ